jgi:hypothetical protein
MTWAAAIPKAEPETADSLAPNPDGFMEMNDLPLMLDVVSMLNVDEEQLQNLKQWLLCAPDDHPVVFMACMLGDGMQCP